MKAKFYNWHWLFLKCRHHYKPFMADPKRMCCPLTEALINEVKDTNVTITALQPGVTNTDFFNKAGAQNSKLAQDKSKMANPADVAKDGYDVLMKGGDKTVSGLQNKIQSVLSNVMPDTVLANQTCKQPE